MLFFDTETTGIENAHITCAAACDSAGVVSTWHSGGGVPMTRETGLEVAAALLAAYLVVSLNGSSFDLRLLWELTGNDDLKPLVDNHIDIMYDFVSANRYYTSMDSFATATLGEGKSNTGKWAAEAWFNGQHNEVLQYCARDVEVLRLLHTAACSDKTLRRKTRSGNIGSWDLPTGFRTVGDARAAVGPRPHWMRRDPPPLPDLSWC